MDYKLYEIEDFVADESYLRYYFRLNDADTLFWQNWISTHPEKLDVVINADQLISFLFLQLSEEEFQQECDRMLKAIVANQKHSLSTNVTRDAFDLFPTPASKKRVSVWAVAAVFIAVFCTGIFLFLSGRKTDESNAVKLLGTNKVQQVKAELQTTKLHLEDGTIVTLQPGAKLMYPPHFLAGKREVYLTGEAFFEVSKNAKRPFYVYYNHLVTHVLGTSFNIKIDKRKKEVEVAVRTGRVEVYEQSAEKAGNFSGSHGNGVILTPNQRVIYKESSDNFESYLVDKPLPVVSGIVKGPAAPVDIDNDIINAASLADIIMSLETIYQISIEVESDNIKNCHFSGDISHMGLYAKLDVVCKAIGATYEIKGTKIIIRGKGCD